MADSLIPLENCSAPAESFELRRDLGHALLVVAGQIAAVALILALWLLTDLRYAPGGVHSIGFYFGLALAVIVLCGGAGLLLRCLALPNA